MLRYFIFIEYGLLPDLRVGVLISASQIPSMIPRNCMIISLQKPSQSSKTAVSWRS